MNNDKKVKAKVQDPSKRVTNFDEVDTEYKNRIKKVLQEDI